MSTNARTARQKALVVHPDVQALSTIQGAFVHQEVTAIVARDFPTALLAVAQHAFDFVIISSNIVEEGDGWPLASVLHIIFPRAVIGVIVPDKSVATLTRAINNGVTDVYEHTTPPAELIAAMLRAPSTAPVQ